MIERKTYKADLERQRPKIFLLALLISTALFFIALNWKSHDYVAEMLDNIDDDVSIDMDLLPALEPEKNIIAAEVKKAPESSEKINKVDEVKEQNPTEELKEQLKFQTSEGDDLDKMQEKDLEPIAPPVTNMNGEDVPLRVVEELPEFPGGMSEFVQWLNRALHYPARAKQLKQQGLVAMTFVVEKDGSITNLKFTKETHTALDAEVLRVMRLMPKWKPGKDHGKPCRCMVGVPIVFAM